MIAERILGPVQLSDDKFTLMTELWQDMTDNSSADDPALAELVEQRWRDYQQHPECVSAWSDVKARILASDA